ncbi:MAG: DUF952 domain-containing protein [Brevibacterium aurantiacum]|nr:DUF952 domain-containing protein [Brevibacterium aurantiacum]
MSLAVWHLALATDWAAAQTLGEYAVSTLGATVDEVGFVHASYDHEQVGRVAARVYGGVAEPLVLLPLDPHVMADVGITVKSEPGDPTDSAGECFPHLYGGPIPVAAFMAALPVHMTAGKLVLDEPAVDLLRQQMDVREAAYAVVTDGPGRVLLARLRGGSDHGRWTLPGGGLDRDESPEDAVVREVREETGYEVRLVRKLGVDILIIPSRERVSAGDGPLAGVRHIYQALVTGGALRHEMNGSTDLAAWHGTDERAVLSSVELVNIALRMSMPIPQDIRGPSAQHFSPTSGIAAIASKFSGVEEGDVEVVGEGDAFGQESLLLGVEETDRRSEQIG